MRTVTRQFNLFKLLGMTCFLTLFSACASTVEKVDAPNTLQQYKSPAWVLKGSGAFDDSKGKVFYGVASSFGVKNPSLQRISADDQARLEVAKTFEVYVKALTKIYIASTSTTLTPSEEQNIEFALKTVTSATLNGVEIIDHWEHPGRNEFFALARLDFEMFKQNLDNHKELSKETRDGIKERAEKLHQEMEKEVLKKEGKL